VQFYRNPRYPQLNKVVDRFITLPLITRQNGVSKNPDLFTLAQLKTQLNPRSVLLVSQLDKYDHNGLDEYLELQTYSIPIKPPGPPLTRRR
jgi:hypothetical protein